jgi:hypothetical protein
MYVMMTTQSEDVDHHHSGGIVRVIETLSLMRVTLKEFRERCLVSSGDVVSVQLLSLAMNVV